MYTKMFLSAHHRAVPSAQCGRTRNEKRHANRREIFEAIFIINRRLREYGIFTDIVRDNILASRVIHKIFGQ